MKQVLLELQTGEVKTLEVPAPVPTKDSILIASRCSLISPGTERMLVEFGKSNFAGKACGQPHRLQEALEKIRTDGIAATLGSIKAKLDRPLVLGYCNSGTVVETGGGFSAGDRVLSNGCHADIVSVPRNLVARIPNNVDDRTATFAVLGAVALQGTRLIQPVLGERFVVTGLGLIGLLTVQILRANGCQVLGMDYDKHRLELAREYGAQTIDLSREADPQSSATAFSNGIGVDGVLVTTATASNEPLTQAAKMCRKRGRIVLVGVSGLELNRADFYEKELSLQVSCSYGPGRHDPGYELHGNDYPPAYVRWTAQRNFQAVLDLMASGKINVSRLVSSEFPIRQADKAYDRLIKDRSVLGILFHYDDPPANSDRTITLTRNRNDKRRKRRKRTQPAIGVIGAGNHANRTLIKSFSDSGARLDTIVSLAGLKAAHSGRKFGFEKASSDADATVSSPEINTVVICTRHDTHARFVLASLNARKNVFVEKPLCLRLSELEAISEIAAKPGGPLLLVGFNRRFAPMIIDIKRQLDTLAEPKSFIMNVNAGRVPTDHWLHDSKKGGGRILGEACHFVDLLRHLADAPVSEFDVKVSELPHDIQRRETAIISLAFADGSIGVVNYFTNGHKAVSKERLEVHCAGRSILLENFRRLRTHGFGRLINKYSWIQDKGHNACAQAFCDAIRNGGPAPIPLGEIIEVSRLSIEAAERAI